MSNDSPMKKQEVEGAYDLVERVLEGDEDSRNSDTVLVNVIWQHQAQKLYGKDLHDLTTSEVKELTPSGSIVRARRKIQNDEKRFPPTSREVIEQRAKNEDVMSEWAKKNMQESLDS